MCNLIGYYVTRCSSSELIPDALSRIGVITPYRGQIEAIEYCFEKLADTMHWRDDSHNPLTIEVNSVDAFQGREKDIIIFSCVRSGNRGGVRGVRAWCSSVEFENVTFHVSITSHKL